jgi:glucose/arabinose dehydrogenase
MAALAGACGSDSMQSPSPTPSPTPSGESCSATPVQGTPNLTTQRVVDGLQAPLDLQVPTGDRHRLFVVEQGGRIRIVRDGALVATAFLDIASRISTGGERGLLGLAFHPAYAQNGRFFVNYTDPNGDTHIVEFHASSNPDVADAGSERLLLFVHQPYANHNGGGLAFGHDGKLYIALGDGGSSGDPQRHAQDRSSALGKLLRIDVDTGTPFGVPPDNPFVARPGAFPPIWAYGLRNPFRFSFDRATGDLYIGDVGQDTIEEVDVTPVGAGGGQNYGWNIMEGNQCYPPGQGCSQSGLTLPAVTYTHGDGCAVTGGIVYQGCRMPGYHGTYFYGDYCSGFVRSFRFQNGGVSEQRDWTSTLGRGLHLLSSFGSDDDGEIYLLSYQDGQVLKIVPAS